MKDSTDVEISIHKYMSEWGMSDVTKETVLNFLKYLEIGRSVQLRNPSTQDFSLEELTNKYSELLSKEQAWIQPFSLKEKDKFKPRSDIPPFSKYEGRLRDDWFKVPNFTIDQSTRKAGFDYIRRLLLGGRKGFLRTASLETAIQSLERDTNSGAFMFTRRSEVIDNHGDELRQACLDVISGAREPGEYIMTIRAKEGRISLDTPTDARVVMMSSIHETAVSLMVQIPLLSYLKRFELNFPSMTGPSQDDVASYHILKKGLTLSGDISGFDMSVHVNKIEEFRDFCLEAFAPSSHEIVNAVISMCIEGKLMTPRGVLPAVGHKIKSGFGLTNLMGCFINSVDIATNLIALGRDPGDDRFSFCVNGDDFVLGFQGIDINEYADVSMSHGMELEPSKQLISSDIVAFNARFSHIADGPVSVRTGWRNARSLEFPETLHTLTEGGQSLRLVAINHTFESNLAWQDVVDFHISQDRLGLGTKGPKEWQAVFGQKTLLILGKALGLRRNVPTTLTLAGIAEWPTYRYLADIYLRKQRN